MTNQNKRVILITGASSGIGKACFDYLNLVGHSVYGTSRRADGSDTHMLKVDVTERSTVEHAVQRILDREGTLDVLVNNAGISIVGAAEETTEEDARRQLEANFWGAVNGINAVLPHMREQKKGHLINVSSLAGLFAIPYQAFYTASKHALEGYSEGLRMELRQFNIHVSLIEPGDFSTEISDNREFSGAASEGRGEYHDHFEKTKTIIIQGERDGADVMKIAKLMNRIIQSPSPGLRYAIGNPLDLFAARVKKIIPQPLFEWLIRDHYKIN
jgi:NADP-dependent 3-hydroxy acid dehydrogenase YdfG